MSLLHDQVQSFQLAKSLEADLTRLVTHQTDQKAETLDHEIEDSNAEKQTEKQAELVDNK